MNKEELLKQVRDLKELKVIAEELQAEITAIEDNIKSEMTAQNVTELQIDIFKIRWTPVISNKFDTSAFKKIYSDLYNQFTRKYKTRRFSVV